jgi:hypothetical protein
MGSSRHTINPDGENKMQTIQRLNLRQTWQKLAVILGISIIYIVTFKPLLDAAGPVASALITVPVIVAGWYFGTKAGLIAGLAGIILNTSLLALYTDRGWMEWLITSWPGNLLMLGAGYTTGLLQKGTVERAIIRNELKSRERFISLMGMAARDILAPKTPENKYFYLASHLANLFVADYAYITSWDAAQGQMTLLGKTFS